MEVTTILFPSSYSDGKRVDEDLINEYEAAVNTGIWDIMFFDYDKWFSEGRLVLSRTAEKPAWAVHRGWMMKADQYGALYEELQKQRIELITNPAEYEHFHYFPNVYNDIKDDTPGEFRVFYAGGEVATVSRNSLQPTYVPEPPIELMNKYKGLPSRLYTLDFGELTDGSWRILEAGDGGVSGPSEGQDLETFYRTMHICLNS